MKISFPGLGLVAMVTSPFLGIQMCLSPDGRDSASGVFDLLYMIGWMCTIVGLLQLDATGKNHSGKIVLYVQLALLTIANAWNIWTIFDPLNESLFYFLVDFSWPLSNICLLIVGIVIASKGILQGKNRYIVLFAGLWLPFSLLLMILVSGQNTAVLVISGIYSTVGWFRMGYMIFQSETDVKVRLA
jgi:hypothetical protein